MRNIGQPSEDLKQGDHSRQTQTKNAHRQKKSPRVPRREIRPVWLEHRARRCRERKMRSERQDLQATESEGFGIDPKCNRELSGDLKQGSDMI